MPKTRPLCNYLYARNYTVTMCPNNCAKGDNGYSHRRNNVS